jgi:Kef-type K+ transport system membrane component KefB
LNGGTAAGKEISVGEGAPELLILGLLMATGLAGGLLANRIGLPRVAAYVAAGVLFSPALLGTPLGIRLENWTEPLTTLALGIIAYLIGGSITVKQLRRLGTTILSTALIAALGAMATVFLVLYFLIPEATDGVVLALALATIATTTAPAATVAVIHQYRARGPFSSTLLGVVAIDDVLGILFFSLMLVFVTGDSLGTGLGTAFYEIVGSLVLGILTALATVYVRRQIQQREMLIPLIIGAILLVVGLAQLLHLSILLAAMTLGFTARWITRSVGERLFAPVEYMEETVFLIFFTLAGAHFEPGVFVGNIGLVLLYFSGRIVGKMGGAYLGARLSAAPVVTRNWLGLALIPQAGVAVGLALILSHHPAFQSSGQIIINVILGTTLLYELFGPLGTRFALKQAGELGKKRRRRKK